MARFPHAKTFWAGSVFDRETAVDEKLHLENMRKQPGFVNKTPPPRPQETSQAAWLPDSEEKQPWRLILDILAEDADGPVNMARDQLLLQRVVETSTPAVRLYGWKNAVLSVGRNQKLDRQVDLAACKREGIPLVRRMTGGQAVLHGGDLTYAVAAPTSGGRFSPGIMAVYREISRVFARFFADLGFTPEVRTYSGRERTAQASAVCFSTPSAFELLIGGRKVVGSAQRLLPNAFLQHGSMPMYPQDAVLERIFRGVTAGEIRNQMTDLETLGVWKRFDREQVIGRLAGAFESSLAIELDPRPWTPTERAAAAKITPQFAYLEEP